MARCVLLCLLLVGFLTVQAMAGKSETNPSEVSDSGSETKQHEGAASPVESVSDGEAEAPVGSSRRLGKHHSSDKSVAGGGVIIGGLVTAIFAAVFCYIRVTRKKAGEITATKPGEITATGGGGQ